MGLVVPIEAADEHCQLWIRRNPVSHFEIPTRHHTLCVASAINGDVFICRTPYVPVVPKLKTIPEALCTDAPTGMGR